MYSAPTSPELWTEFLTQLSRELKLTGAAILHHDMEREDYNVQYSSGGDPSWTALYARYYGNLDVWRAPFLNKREGEFVPGAALCPRNEIQTTEFYNDYLNKYDICLFGAVATLRRPKQVQHISLYQSWKGKSPGKHAVHSMSLIFPHLRAALDLRQKIVDLKALGTSMEAAMDRMQAAIFLLDASGHMLHVNRSRDFAAEVRWIDDSRQAFACCLQQ